MGIVICPKCHTRTCSLDWGRGICPACGNTGKVDRPNYNPNIYNDKPNGYINRSEERRKMNKLNIKCPKCNHKFTIKDTDDSRPVIYCDKCNRGYFNPILSKFYIDAVSYDIEEGKRLVRKGIKDILEIGLCE